MVQGISSLVAIGCRSGDTVIGLSSLRRKKKVAMIFADKSIALRTFNELEVFTKDGFGVFRVNDMTPLTDRFGRVDVRVIGIANGSLADGIFKKLKKFE